MKTDDKAIDSTVRRLAGQRRLQNRSFYRQNSGHRFAPESEDPRRSDPLFLSPLSPRDELPTWAMTWSGRPHPPERWRDEPSKIIHESIISLIALAICGPSDFQKSVFRKRKAIRKHRRHYDQRWNHGKHKISRYHYVKSRSSIVQDYLEEPSLVQNREEEFRGIDAFESLCPSTDNLPKTKSKAGKYNSLSEL